MTQILAYSITSSIFLAAGYTAYMLLLSQQKTCITNRICLLAIYAVALCAMPLKSLYTSVQTSIGLPDVAIGPLSFISVTTGETAQTNMSITEILTWIYIAGFIAVAIWSAVGYTNLLRLIHSGQQTRRYGRYTIVTVDGCTVPFSFGKYIVVGSDDVPQLDMILSHERAHLHQLHWLDLLLAQGVCAIMWYNPATWLMRAELRRVHEYSADSAVISAGHDAPAYQKLLMKKATGTRLQSLANSLNHSNIYKRITMMYKKTPSGASRLRAVGLIPALVAAAAVCSTSPVVSATAAESTALSAGKVTKNNSISETTTDAGLIPSYPGGEAAMFKFLIENMRYPEEAAKANEQGRVVVRFIVQPDGSITDVEIIKSVSASLDKEAIRVVKSMTNWTPGHDEAGNAVAGGFVLPIAFKLASDKTTE